MRLSTSLAAILSTLLLTAAPAAAAPAVTGSFPTPDFDGSNAKIAAGPDGNMWLPVNEGGNDVVRIGPDGTVTPFKLGPEIENALGIAAGPEGRMWVTATNKVGSFSPADPEGTIDVDTVFSITSNSPIVAGPDGQMWAAASNAIVHFSPAAPDKAESFPVLGLQPKDIDVAGSLLVVADSGAPRIVTMTTSGAQQDYTIGHFNDVLKLQEGSSQGVAGAPGGQIAFSQPGASPDEVGLINPPNPAQSFERDNDPFGVALGSDGAYWIPLSAGEAVQRLTPDGTSTLLTGLPPKFFPRQIAAGPGNTMWVTMEIPGESIYEVARISGLEPPVKPGGDAKPPTAPETTIDKGPKKKVTIKGKAKRAWAKFRFSSTTRGATFECALTKKPAKKGAKMPKPVFRACKSPGKLRLKPGKYRFSVRAVAGGLVDPTPASRGFRIVRAAPKRAS